VGQELAGERQGPAVDLVGLGDRSAEDDRVAGRLGTVGGHRAQSVEGSAAFHGRGHERQELFGTGGSRANEGPRPASANETALLFKHYQGTSDRGAGHAVACAEFDFGRNARAFREVALVDRVEKLSVDAHMLGHGNRGHTLAPKKAGATDLSVFIMPYRPNVVTPK